MRYTFSVTAGEAVAPSRLGRYELITRIGQGGMADVQLALQHGPAGFEKLVVVKLVHEHLVSEKAFVDMLLDEARVAALLKHPNVVDIYDLGEVDGRYFIAMEYLEGEPLLAVLRAGRDGNRLDVNSTARLIADTADGLDAAHELRSMAGKPLELVHHDVSLGNIVVLYNGQVKLVDFGVAKATQSVSTRSKVQGKFSYMAPEKLAGGDGDRRSDIFSLGVVLWEAITLRRLFKGDTDDETMAQVLESEIPTPSSVNGDVAPRYDAVVMKALARDPAQRYQTAKQLADDLEEILREVNYARKNDAIARYMQQTFKAHIDARKKLLQEVSSKGMASRDVLQAAFVQPPIPIAATAERGEFSIKFKAVTDGDALLEVPTGTPSQPLAEVRVRVETPAGSKPLESFATWQDTPSQIVPPTAAPHRDRKRIAIALAVLGGLIAIAVIATVLGSRGDAAATVAKVVPSQPIDATAAIVIDAAIAVAAAPIDAEAEPEPIELPPVDAAPAVVRPPIAHPDHPATPAPDKTSVDALYKQGLQAFIKGDNKVALDYLRRAQHVSSTHAPTWRVLGLVYERMGEVAQARIAFVRYLQLAPNAADAASTRKKLEGLTR